MALRSPDKIEVVLPNTWGRAYADGTINGPWLFNLTTGTFAAADTPGGAQAMTISTGEGEILEIVGPLAYEIDAGLPITVEAEIMVETDASAKAAVFFGLTDRNDTSEEIAVEDEDGTLETDATDTVGFMLEREQDATWQAVSSNAGTDGAQTALTDASDVADDVWQKLQLSIVKNIDNVAEARYYIDGKLLSHTRTSPVASTVRLAPVITLDGRGAAVTIWVRNFRAIGPGAE